jgi:thiol-disulfide isomerase/thioredoxin
MRKSAILLLLTLFMMSCAANKPVKTQVPDQTPAKDNISIIDGKWSQTAKEINLYAVEKGALKKIATSALDSEKKFYFAFAPQPEGFYVIGINNIAGANNYTFYFKPGDRLNVEIEGSGRYHLVGNNSPENIEVERWSKYMAPIAEKAIYGRGSFVDFFPVLEEKTNAGKYEQQYMGNPEFSRALENLNKYEILYNALNLLITPRSSHPKASDIIGYYKDLDVYNFSGRDILDYPYGMAILSSYSLASSMIPEGKLSQEQLQGIRVPFGRIEVLVPLMQDDIVKGEAVLSEISMIKTIEGYNEIEKRYGNYLVTEEQRESLKGRLKDITIKKGDRQPIIDFKFPDANGKEIALSDFKGKVVYVDVWATWCGPCLAELPFLKELEKKYHDSGVVFLSVSTDKDADRGKWLAMLKEKEMGGIQVFAGDKARVHIIDPYKITGIPRFILVGKDGNLASDNAPRPSSIEIKALLDAELKK